MAERSEPYVALLRGINVGGKNVVRMGELRDLFTRLGCSGVTTYIQSGTVVFRTHDAAGPGLEERLEQGFRDAYGFSVPVLVRSARSWEEAMRGNPFPDEAEAEPGAVLLALSKEPPAADCVEELSARAANGERIRRVGDVLWIHFPEGAGRSKLSPGLLDRHVGSPVTTRNWRTVVRIAEMVQG